MASAPNTKGKIAIVGSGLIGRGWAMLFAGGEYLVSLYDSDQKQLSDALEFIRLELARLESQGFLRGQLGAKDQAALVQSAESLEKCVEGAVHVQECVPERIELKQAVFEQLDALVGPDTVLSSSTSAIACSMFTGHLKHRNNCIVAHPVNPPYYMRLVELVPAPWTEAEVVLRTRALMDSIGQSPVVLKKELPGFVQPRVQYAIIEECVKLVLDGVMSAADVDKVMVHGLGRRYAFMGPFQTIHLNAEGAESYMQRYAEMIFEINKQSASVENVRLHDDPRMEKVFEELEAITPLDQVREKQRWRDGAIASLCQLRERLDRETNE